MPFNFQRSWTFVQRNRLIDKDYLESENFSDAVDEAVSTLAGDAFIFDPEMDALDFSKPLVLPAYNIPDRPSAAQAGKGAMIYDNTMEQPLWSNGSEWVDALGDSVP